MTSVPVGANMSNKPTRPTRKASRTAVFLAVQAVLISAAMGTAWVAFREDAHRGDLPPLRDEPLVVEPLYDCPWIIGDEQLIEVLYRLRPRLAGPKPKINHVDHALRFWGVEAEFSDPACLSGRQMRDILLDHARFAEVWGDDAKPFLGAVDDGVAYRTKEGSATASHVDHTMASLGEVGVPLSFPVRLPDGVSNVGAMLHHAMRSFCVNQLEYEWSALAFTLYFRSPQPWHSSEGQEITFDRLAERIMRQRFRQGVCYGNHRLHTLVMMLRVDRDHAILSAAMRAQIIAHLRGATAALVGSQHADGYWERNWAEGVPPDDKEPIQSVLSPLSRRFLATGHAMEWWALAPPEVQPPREVLARAGAWMARTVLELDDDAVLKNYTFLSHVGRGAGAMARAFSRLFSAGDRGRSSRRRGRRGPGRGRGGNLAIPQATIRRFSITRRFPSTF